MVDNPIFFVCVHSSIAQFFSLIVKLVWEKGHWLTFWISCLSEIQTKGLGYRHMVQQEGLNLNYWAIGKGHILKVVYCAPMKATDLVSDKLTLETELLEIANEKVTTHMTWAASYRHLWFLLLKGMNSKAILLKDILEPNKTSSWCNFFKCLFKLDV